MDGNPVTEDRTAKQTEQAAPSEAPDSPTNKRGSSRVVLAVLAGAFVLAAAAATAVLVGGRILEGETGAFGRPEGRDDGRSDAAGRGRGDLEEAGRAEGVAVGQDLAVPSISGSLVLRASNSTTALVSDSRFHEAVAKAMASTLSSQTGGNITAEAVEVCDAATKPPPPASSLRGHGRRLEGEGETRVKYCVFLDSEGAPVPEDAARLLAAMDPAALNSEIAAEIALQGFEQDTAVEVVGITAEVVGAEAASDSLYGAGALGDSEHDGRGEGHNEGHSGSGHSSGGGHRTGGHGEHTRGRCNRRGRSNGGGGHGHSAHGHEGHGHGGHGSEGHAAGGSP